MKFDSECNDIIEGMDPFFKRVYTPPEDAYQFDKDHIPPEAWEQNKYWHDKKGIVHRINQMEKHHVWAIINMINEGFPEQRNSLLYKALMGQYLRLRAKEITK